MALILALNPGNRHSPTLSRLARELLGSELIGAESCVVAIRAINERLPDVVLLPAKPARGEADLMAHLTSVPGGVLTLRLPPVELADPVELAKQIREMLAGAAVSADVAPPLPRGTSPHLLAAATATINWIRKRREQWDHQPVPDEPVPQRSGVSSAASDVRHDPSERHEPDHTSEASPSEDPFADATQRSTWIPRAAALAVVIGIVGGMVACWPQVRGAFGSTSAPVSAPIAVSRPSPETTIAVRSSEPAEVLIDATRAGDTPYKGTISLGTHAVTVRHAGGERQVAVEATSEPVELEVDFSKP